MSKIIALQTGTSQTYTVDGAGNPLERPWATAIQKRPVAGPVRAGPLGLAGDGVHDTNCHGGPWQAILMYCAEHYPKWNRELGRSDMGPGMFGENLTVTGMDEDTACIGDRLRMGQVDVEVTIPRGPCNTLARWLGVKEIIRLVLDNHRSGWYLKVLVEGDVEAGMEVTLLERPNPAWTIARAADAHTHRRARPDEARALAAIPGLDPRLHKTLLEAADAA
ncbi:MAG: MOSC domain-containing protein [Gemmatimonadales bacterium]